MSGDGTGDTRLTTNFCGSQEARWRHDGARIAFVQMDRVGGPGSSCDRSNVWTMNPDGTGLVQVTTGDSDSSPAWAPDGSRIAFASARDAGGKASRTEIYTVKPDGTDVRRLTDDVFRDRRPSYTPDGSRIVFTRQVELLGFVDENAWTMKTDGSDQRRLTSGGAIDAVYSPSGTRVAFAEDGRVWTMNADGTGLTAWTADVDATQPVWSPFSEALLYTAETDPTAPDSIRNIFRLTLTKGAAPVRVTSDTAVLDQTTANDWLRLGKVTLVPPPPDRFPPLVRLVGNGGIAGSALLGGTFRTAATAGAAAGPVLSARRSALQYTALDRTGIRSLALALAKPVRGGCRWLTKRGLGKTASCATPVLLTVRGTGELTTRLEKAPPGTYRITFRTADVRGNARTLAAREIRLT